MKETIGIGIIGTGSIAGHHLKSVQELDNCQVVALASSSPERAKIATEKFGMHTYSDYRQLVDRTDIDMVIICTHSGNHLGPAQAAAKAGKHVLVEKPLEISLERADQMIKACKTAGVKLGCIFQNRFSPDYRQLKKAVEEGALGKLHLGNAYIKWYRSPEYYRSSFWKGTMKGDGGAALINQGIHTIDLLLDIMGEVKSVFGKVATVNHRIEGEDLGLALVTFADGALGTIESSTAITPGYPERLEIYGNLGSVILEGGKIRHWFSGEDQLDAASKGTGEPTGAADPMAISHQLHKAQINDFVEAIRYDREPLVTGEEGRRSLELILKIYESSEKGVEIKFG